MSTWNDKVGKSTWLSKLFTPDPTERQQRRMGLDRSQDAYMAKVGIVVVRVWESDLKSRPDVARARILAAIGSPEGAAEANAAASTGGQLALL